MTGTVDEVQQNTYDRATDDPAARGGNAVAILGDDGVRYYMAHFQAVEPNIVPGARATAGDLLGQMGETGRAGACHVHFASSLPCPEHGDWWIRRGVIWPDRYLDSWKAGENLSPLPELQAVVRRVSRRLPLGRRHALPGRLTTSRRSGEIIRAGRR